MISVEGDKNPAELHKINSLYRKEYYQWQKILLYAKLPTEEACSLARKLVELNIKYDREVEI